MRKFLAVILSLALTATAFAGEAEDRAEKARLHFESGMAHFNLEEWDLAIREWEDGYRLKPVTEFLYNIAQAYRKSNRAEKALTFYQRYLRLEPNAPNRGEVEKHIASLTKLVEQQRAAAKAPPDRPIESSSVPPSRSGAATEPPPTPASSDPAASGSASSAPSEPALARADLTASAPERKPLYKKAWFWGVVAGGAVIVAGVVVGVVLGTQDNSRILPQARF